MREYNALLFSPPTIFAKKQFKFKGKMSFLVTCGLEHMCIDFPNLRNCGYGPWEPELSLYDYIQNVVCFPPKNRCCTLTKYIYDADFGLAENCEYMGFKLAPVQFLL